MERQELRQHIEHFYRLYTEKYDMYQAIIGVHDKELEDWPYAKYRKYADALENASGAYPDQSEHCGFVRLRSGLREGKHVRFYMNSHDSESVIEIAGTIFNKLKKKAGFQLKTIGPRNYGFSRFDNTVLYVNANDNVRLAAEELQKLSCQEGLFDEETPFAARKIARGVCYAFTPVSCHRVILGQYLRHWKYAFNELHSIVLERTFGVCAEKQITGLEEMFELYTQALVEARINPEKPHLSIGVQDPLADIESLLCQPSLSCQPASL